MALPVSSEFLAAQSSDINQIAEQVFLILGNYASSPGYLSDAAASSEDVSGDYPAMGAIDGDRTEINIGPGATADNNIGESSWKSSVAPDTTPQTLTISFNATRTLNRVKVYHRSTNIIGSYTLSYWTGSAWVIFAGTPDQNPLGFGRGGYGQGGYGGIGTFTEIGPSVGPLDVIDTQDITTTQIQMRIYRMASAGTMAEVVELEVYRKVDITSRVKSVKISRQRDYKISNPMAAALSLEVINDDRFFSFSHVPTDYVVPAPVVVSGYGDLGYGEGGYGGNPAIYAPPSELSQGFINEELRPNMGILVKLGFSYGGGVVETPQVFIGSVDRITVRPKSRSATIECRDYMKGLINRTTSSKLKTNLDISACIQYVLNLQNISNYEMSLDFTTITIDYFFTLAESVLTTIQNLVQACGDAIFYFDENGIATFKYYAQTTPHAHTDTTTADFNAGTVKTNVGFSNLIRRQFFRIDDFANGNYTSNPVWHVQGGNGLHQGTWTVVGSTLQWFSQSNISTFPGVIRTSTTPVVGAYGTWSVKVQFPDASKNGKAYFYFVAGTSPGIPPNSTLGQGYAVAMYTSGGSGHLVLYKADASGTLSQLGGIQNIGIGTTIHTLTISRDGGAGQILVYWDGGLVENVVDNTYTTSSFIGCAADETSSATGLKVQFSEIFYSYANTTDTPTNAVSVFESQIIDQSTDVSVESVFNATIVTPAGTSVAFFTATSPDGVTFDPYLPVVIGAQIPSAPQRYIKYKAILHCPVEDDMHNADIRTPLIYDVTVNWITLSGTPKYPPFVSFIFSFDSTLLDVSQEIADNLGGDTSIINDVSVQAQPLILSGNNSDVLWQGTVGVPANPISVSNKLTVVPGVYTYPVALGQGMDISRMSGANPAAAAVTFADGAAGSWIITNIHPSQPVIQITVTVAGSISLLTLSGKIYSSDSTPVQQQSSDPQSIDLYGDRQQQISNSWIINTLIANQIAQRLVDNSKNPTAYIPSADAQPTFSAQIGDRVTVIDDNLDLSADYIIVGLDHDLSAGMGNANCATHLVLLKVPDVSLTGYGDLGYGEGGYGG